MLFHKSFFVLALSLAPGVFAAQEQRNYKIGLQPRAAVVTVTSILPTKSIVSPPDAECTVTFTTVLPSLGTNPGGVPTGVTDHTYTMEFGCKGSSGSPCAIPSAPEQLPPGFTVTTKICDTCADDPVTYTLTVPNVAAATKDPSSGPGSGNSHDSGESGQGSSPSGSSPLGGAGTPEDPPAKPTKVPANAPANSPADESTDDVSEVPVSESEQPKGGNGDNSSSNENQGGNAGGTGSGADDESGSTETVGVSAGSSTKFALGGAWEVLFLTVLLIGMNM
jgi:hypothetical protein